MKPADAEAIDATIRQRGYVHVRGPLDLAAYRRIADALGVVVAEEVIALRPGAHAYVAKSGPVPLHTDQPQVEIASWLCIQQDEQDGASLLFDARPTIEALTADQRALLRRVYLSCPPVAGGPPRLRFPVLRPGRDSDLLFCSPWLQSADQIVEHQAALDELRNILSAAAKEQSIDVHLAPGDALFIDNQRVLHGRRAIAEASRRQLHRLWIIRHETAASE
jgi:hypothetical protein